MDFLEESSEDAEIARELTRKRRREERRRRKSDIDDYQRGKEVEVKEVEKDEEKEDVDRHGERERERRKPRKTPPNVCIMLHCVQTNDIRR